MSVRENTTEELKQKKMPISESRVISKSLK